MQTPQTNLRTHSFRLMVVVDHACFFSNQPLEEADGDDRDEV